MIVDDEEDFDHLMKLSLEADGDFSVRYVSESTKALDTAREFQPDVVILDVKMPGLDGGELAVLLKSDPLLGDVPIIFLTASFISGTKDESPTLFGYPCVEKPAAVAEVVHLIETCLAGHNGARTQRAIN